MERIDTECDWSTQPLIWEFGWYIYCEDVLDHDTDVKDYKFNLANCRLRQTKRNQRLQQKYPFDKTSTNAQEAAARNFKGVADADYYEVYEKMATTGVF